MTKAMAIFKERNALLCIAVCNKQHRHNIYNNAFFFRTAISSRKRGE